MLECIGRCWIDLDPTEVYWHVLGKMEDGSKVGYHGLEMVGICRNDLECFGHLGSAIC